MTGHDVLQGVLLALLVGPAVVFVVPRWRRRRAARRWAFAGLFAYAGVLAAAVPAAMLIR